MQIDPASLAPRDMYQLMIAAITPRPIAWVSTISPRGITNLAPFSFFNGVAANPPTIVFSPVNHRDGSKKDTVVNVEQTSELVVNVVDFASREAMNATSSEIDYELSEFERFGVAAAPSVKVRPPRVATSPVSFECVLHQIVPVGSGALAANLIIARIVFVHVDERVRGADGRLDPAALDTIGRLGADHYTRTTDRFSLPRPR